jgi:LPXTG-site transpeptidase (sortase) family protein
VPPPSHESMSFHPPAPSFRPRWVIKPILAVIAIFVIACLGFSSPVLLLRLRYQLSQPGHSARGVSAATGFSLPPPTTESQLVIPKIKVMAPIVYEPSLNEADILRALQSGVIHYATTSVPGQAGNVVIFGHSSDDWWDSGNYKFVFVLLDKLTVGDQVIIDYQARRYTYLVTGSRVVAATDFSVLKPTVTPTLTLITCSPLGTSLRRLVVTAKQVSPGVNNGATASASAPVTAVVASGQTLGGSSGVSGAFWDVLAVGWDSLFHWH